MHSLLYPFRQFHLPLNGDGTDSNASSCTYMILIYTTKQYYIHLNRSSLVKDQDRDQGQDQDQDHNQAGLISSFCPLSFDSGPGVGDFGSLSRGMWSWILAINSDAAFWEPS